jgi:hypothetical protein
LQDNRSCEGATYGDVIIIISRRRMNTFYTYPLHVRAKYPNKSTEIRSSCFEHIVECVFKNGPRGNAHKKEGNHTHKSLKYTKKKNF